MCRMLAYLGPEVALDSLVLTPPFALLRQSYEPRFQQRGRVNADGFGVGWYAPAIRPEPARYRRAVPIWADRSFASFAPLVRSGAVVASVRNATPPSPSEESSTAPFTAGPWLFAHNGEVAHYAGPDGGRGSLLARVSPARAAGIEGGADSEVLFALALDRLDAGATAGEALAAVVHTVRTETGGRLNMILTDGETLAATAGGDSLYVLQRPDPAGVVVASEPYDDDPAWQPVPDGTLVRATAAGVIQEAMHS